MTQANAVTGSKSSIGTTALQLISASTKVQYGVEVKARATNTAKVYVGYSSAITGGTTDATDGFELSAGDAVFIAAAAMGSDLSNVWVISTTTGQAVSFMGL